VGLHDGYRPSLNEIAAENGIELPNVHVGGDGLGCEYACLGVRLSDKGHLADADSCAHLEHEITKDASIPGSS
jgi:hypothetical protein